MAQPIATIDVGTNTAHLLISFVDQEGGIVPVHDETRYVRLGQGVDASGAIHPDALRRLRAALLDFKETAERARASQIILAGTSASRDADDGSRLVSYVRNETGLEYQIISGEEEAILTSIGAISGVDTAGSPALVVDIGGGSTELCCVSTVDGRVSLDAAISLDIGSVRLTERCFTSQPPAVEEIRRAETLVTDLLKKINLPGADERLMVGAAGTVRALERLIHGDHSASGSGRAGRITKKESGHWRDRLLKLGFEETLALNPAVLTGRADVIASGVLIFDLLLERFSVDSCLVSHRGLRHGLALRYASQVAGSGN